MKHIFVCFVYAKIFRFNVLIQDGNSLFGAHVWNDTGNLIFLRHLFRSTAAAIPWVKEVLTHFIQLVTI